jgi:hypothetical protein
MANATRTVGLVSRRFSACDPKVEARATCGTREQKRGPMKNDCCNCASAALLVPLRDSLQRALNAMEAPDAHGSGGSWRVIVRDGDTSLGSMVRLALARHASVCLSSTFCLWPTLAAPRGRWPATSSPGGKKKHAGGEECGIRRCSGSDDSSLLFAGAPAAEALLSPGFAVLRDAKLVPYSDIQPAHAATCHVANVAARLAAKGVLDRAAWRGATQLAG